MQLAALNRRIDQLVEAICNGADALAVNSKLKALEVEKAELERNFLPKSDAQPLLHPALATLYRRQVEQLESLLSNPSTNQEAVGYIRSLIEEVRLVPEGARLAVELRGNLAGVLAMTESAQRPGWSADKSALQIKMVAAAGFEPATFRL